MKALRLIAVVLPVIAVISISAGCGDNGGNGNGDGTQSINSTNSTDSNSPGAMLTASIPDLLTNCPVTGDPLGSMGTPYVIVYKGQEVKFCCASCTNEFFKDPDKYIKMIRAADKTATK